MHIINFYLQKAALWLGLGWGDRLEPGEGTDSAAHHSPLLLCLPLAACTYKNQECRLTIHYENGFSVTTEPQEGAFPKTVIQAPYEKLKTSSDDGIRMLYLDFGGKDGELVSTLFFRQCDFVYATHPYWLAHIILPYIQLVFD